MSWKYNPNETSVFGDREVDLGAKVLGGSTAFTLTSAETQKTYYLNRAAGFTVTLPAAALGLRFTFIVMTAPTTAYIIAPATADTLSGTILSASGAAEDTEGAATGDQLNFVASTAVAGDRAEFNCDGTSWHCYGIASAAGGLTITG